LRRVPRIRLLLIRQSRFLLVGLIGLAAAVMLPGPVGAGDATEREDDTMSGTESADYREFDQLWDYDDPAATEAKFREALAAAETAEDTGAALQIRTQIARTLGLQKRYDDATEVLDAVEPKLAAAPPVVRVRWLLERGRILNTSGDRGGARPVFEGAWEAARACGEDGFAVDAAHMIAIVAESDEAMAWNERALQLARTSDDPRAKKWRGSLLNNQGWTHHDQGRHEEALALFREALEARREQGDEKLIGIARWCVARCQRSLGRIEEALAAQEQLLKEAEAANAKDGYVLEEIAECLLALDRGEEARPYFARAHAVLSEDPWLPEGEPERLARLAELGGVTAGAGE